MINEKLINSLKIFQILPDNIVAFRIIIFNFMNNKYLFYG